MIDLTKYKRRQEETSKNRAVVEIAKEPQKNVFGLFDNSLISVNQNASNLNEDTEDKKKKLAKRLADMTTQIENISNQIYHLSQRVEVLERKSGVNSGN